MDNNIKDYKIKVVDLFNINKKLIKLKNFNKLILSKKFKKYTLIYPADNLYHKNHINLFIALKILAKSNIYPRVLLTLDKKKNSEFFKFKKLYNLNVDFKVLKKKDMINAYKNTHALIYPSLNETIGLPIHEALSYGLHIIASNLPYVNQFIKNDLLFDPFDPTDIANKIKFFLNKKKYNNLLLSNKICITSKEFSKIF
jgi:glycosyltransferase involved in cell wall biosynthesis